MQNNVFEEKHFHEAIQSKRRVFFLNEKKKKWVKGLNF